MQTFQRISEGFVEKLLKRSTLETSIFIFLFVFCASVTTVFAQTPTRVPVGIVGLTANTIHPFVSQDSGLFQKYGIDAQLIVFQGGSLVAQASMANEIKISIFSGPVTIASRVAGGNNAVVAAFVNTFPYTMIAAKGITTSEQLRDKKIAISRFGSSTDTAVRLFLAKFDLNPEKDVTLLQIGSQSSRYAALLAGSIDATIVGLPFDIMARKQGYSLIANLAQLNIPYPQSVVDVSDRFLHESPHLVKNFLKGLIAGIQYGLTNKDGTKKILDKYLKIKDPEILEATYQEYLRTTDRKLYPNLVGFKFALDEVAKRVPAARGKQVNEFVNTRILDELEKEGFLKEIYK